MARPRQLTDPDDIAEYERATRAEQQTKAEQAAAQREADYELERKAKIEKEDAKKIKVSRRAEKQAQESAQSRQARDRKKYLATPLSIEEKAELAILEELANAQGQGSPDPDMMRSLADMRVRGKVKGDKDE